MKQKWEDFWHKYRIVDIKSDNDLLYQCGMTVGGKPIGPDLFGYIIQDISTGLELTAHDRVLDLCCGNGMITYELGKKAHSITGIDFSPEYLNNANKHKKSPTIEYILHNVTKLSEIGELLREKRINKVLLYGSLAYVSKEGFEDILLDLHSLTQPFTKIYIGSILDKQKKWKFFNTLSRKFALLKLMLFNDDPGIGNWWSRDSIQRISREKGYSCRIRDQNPFLHTAHYRFDVVLTKEK